MSVRFNPRKGLWEYRQAGKVIGEYQSKPEAFEAVRAFKKASKGKSKNI